MLEREDRLLELVEAARQREGRVLAELLAHLRLRVIGFSGAAELVREVRLERAPVAQP